MWPYYPLGLKHRGAGEDTGESRNALDLFALTPAGNRKPGPTGDERCDGLHTATGQPSKFRCNLSRPAAHSIFVLLLTLRVVVVPRTPPLGPLPAPLIGGSAWALTGGTAVGLVLALGLRLRWY